MWITHCLHHIYVTLILWLTCSAPLQGQRKISSSSLGASWALGERSQEDHCLWRWSVGRGGVLTPGDAPCSQACLLPPAAGRCGVGKEGGLPAGRGAFLPGAGTACSPALVGLLETLLFCVAGDGRWDVGSCVWCRLARESCQDVGRAPLGQGRAGGGQLGMDCGTGFFLRAKPTFLGMAEQAEVKGAVIWCIWEPAGKSQISSQAHARGGAAFSGSPFLPHSKY